MVMEMEIENGERNYWTDDIALIDIHPTGRTASDAHILHVAECWCPPTTSHQSSWLFAQRDLDTQILRSRARE
jgi:hypothetical protein